MTTLLTRPQDDSARCAVSITLSEVRALKLLLNKYWAPPHDPEAAYALAALGARARETLLEDGDSARQVQMAVSLREAWAFVLYLDEEVAEGEGPEMAGALASVERRYFDLLIDRGVAERDGDLWWVPGPWAMSDETRLLLALGEAPGTSAEARRNRIRERLTAWSPEAAW